MSISSTTLLLFYLRFITNFALGEAWTVIEAENFCIDPIWVAVVSSPGSPELPVSATGFVLFPHESVPVWVPPNWSGLVWARTHCSTDPAFLCLTGDCASRAVECPAGTLFPPSAATFARFGAVAGGYEFFVTAAAGFNLAVLVGPAGGSGPRCGSTGYVGLDLKACPEEFRVVDGGGDTVGCKAGFEYDLTDVAVISPTFACFSASYHVRFCASDDDFSTHTGSSSEEPGPEKDHPKKTKKKKKKIKSALPLIASIVSTVSSVTGLLWWVVRKFGSGGCCNQTLPK